MNHPSQSFTALLLVMFGAVQAYGQQRPPSEAPPRVRGSPPPAQLAADLVPDSGTPVIPSSNGVGNAVAPGQAIAPRRPTCEESRRKSRYNIYFDKVEIEKLLQTVADVTCRTFILPDNIRGKISIIGPENGKLEVSADQFYSVFLASLDANNLSVYAQGRYIKIIEKPRAKQSPIPTTVDSEAQYTTNEQMMTRIFKLKNVDVEPLRGVIQQLVSPSGDAIAYSNDTLIVNDIGANMHRIDKIIAQLDSALASDDFRVIQVKYASVADVSDRIQKLFESRINRPGLRPAPVATSGVPGSGAPSGPVTLTQLIPDERTNKLLVIASPAAIERIDALLAQLDVPISGEGRINVVGLENANADEVAQTLQALAQGTSARRSTAPAAAGARATTSAELFSGEVKISADKPTNSLVIIANQSDFKNLSRVIERLDIRRRQVFIEAVIMEVNIQRETDLGVNFHGGILNPDSSGQSSPVFFGSRYNSTGLPPSLNLVNSLSSLGGFLAGIQGPNINLNVAGTNITIPSFGVVLNALQTSSDVNVLSTPHILTTDNEEAEISVGQNVPFQSGYSSGLSSLSSLTGAGTNSLSGLGSLGTLPYGQIQRQNVELKLTIKPQINSNDYVRLGITESIEEIASQDAVLGPTTSKRSAKTTVVARDQETVVIGGIMQDRLISTVSKIPLLGDIPIIGNLFRSQTRRKAKVNLLLFLTPYVIRDTSDFRRIFERKMKERQEFIEQFYGASSVYDTVIDYSRKPGPLARMVQVVRKEEDKLENGGPGTGDERLIIPGPIAPFGPQGPTSTVPAGPERRATTLPAGPPEAEPATNASGNQPTPTIAPPGTPPNPSLPSTPAQVTPGTQPSQPPSRPVPELN